MGCSRDRLSAFSVALITACCLCTCSDDAAPPLAAAPPQPPPSATPVAPPAPVAEATVEIPFKNRIVFQPCLLWANGEETFQGTGFFAKSPDGQAVAAITSAHFLDFDGPVLQRVHWLDVKTDDRVATMTTSWGQPGRKNPRRSDYFMMPVTQPLAEGIDILELDDREKPEPRERVWFPDKNPKGEMGHVWVAGTVSSADAGGVNVDLDTAVALQSQSGTPFISQKTHKVIGTLIGGFGKTIMLAPVGEMRKVLQGSDRPLLVDVVGKTDKDKPARYPVPTLAGDEPPIKAGNAKPADSDLLVEYIDWRQMEFAPDHPSNDVHGFVKGVAQFKARHWHDAEKTWMGIYWRREHVLPLSDLRITPAALEKSVGQPAQLKHTLFTYLKRKEAQVEGGFTLEIPGFGSLYGHTVNGSIASLGVVLQDETLDRVLTARVLRSVASSHKLVLIDWYRTKVLKLDDDASFQAWLRAAVPPME